MINKNEGTITLVDENNNSYRVQAILEFEVVELNKKYIVYTFDNNKNKDEYDVMISEFNSDTNEIIKIPENEKEFVLECYANLKESLLSNNNANV